MPFKAAGTDTSGVDVIDGVHSVNGDSINIVISSRSKLYYPLPISMAVVLHDESIVVSQLSLIRPSPCRTASNDHFARRIQCDSISIIIGGCASLNQPHLIEIAVHLRNENIVSPRPSASVGAI